MMNCVPSATLWEYRTITSALGWHHRRLRPPNCRFLGTLGELQWSRTSPSSTIGAKAQKKRKKKTSAVPKTSVPTVTFDGRWSLPTTTYHGQTEQSMRSSTKPPLVLLSGWGGMALDWGSIPTMLASGLKCNVSVYDPRGLGQSVSLCNSGDDQGNEPNISLEQMSMDVVAILQSLQDKQQQEHHKFRLLGVSMGGVMAQMVAAAAMKSGFTKPATDTRMESFPNFSIESMVLIATTHRDTSPFPNSPFLHCFDPWMRQNEGHDVKRQCAERFFEALGDDFLRRPGRQAWKKRLVDGFLASRTDADILGTLAQRDALFSARLEPEDNSENNGPPCLILHGEDDRVVPLFHGEELYNKLLPSSSRHLPHRFISIPSCDHLCWISNGTDVVAQVVQWYRQKDQIENANI